MNFHIQLVLALMAFFVGGLRRSDGGEGNASLTQDIVNAVRVQESATPYVSFQLSTFELKGMASTKFGKGPRRDLELVHENYTLDDLSVSLNPARIGVASFYFPEELYRFEYSSEGQLEKRSSNQPTLHEYGVVFDGEVHVFYAENRLPGYPSVNSTILFEYDDESIRSESDGATLLSSGLKYLPGRIPLIPKVFPGYSRLLTAELLEGFFKNEEVRVAKEDHGRIVTLEVPQKGLTKGNGVVVYRLDAKRGYALTSMRVHSSIDTPPFKEVAISLQKWPNGVWGPMQVTEYNWASGQGKRLVFEDVVIEDRPPGGAFTIQPPEGATVYDHMAGMIYQVSSGPINEAAAAAEYVRVFKVRPRKHRFVQKTLFGILVVCVLCASIFIQRRRKLRHSGALMLLGCCCLNLTGCGLSEQRGMENVQPAKGFEESENVVWDNGWRTSVSANNKYYASQCGFRATVMMLEMFGAEYDPLEVARYLKPTLSGVRLSDMRKVLRVHGVQTATRSEIDLSILSEFVDVDRPALVHLPSTSSRQSHYVIVCKDEKGVTTLLDHPKPPVNLDAINADELSKFDHLIAMFCTRKTDQKKGLLEIRPSEIRVSPKKFDNGVMSETVEVVNTGERVQQITRIRADCSCTTVDYEPAILEPGESMRITVTIDAVSWGSEENRRTLAVFDHDQLQKTLEIQGHAYGSDPQHGTTVRQIKRRVSVPLECDRTFSRKLKIQLKDCEREDVKNLILESQDRNTVHGRIGCQEDESCCLEVELDMTMEQIRAVSDGRRHDWTLSVFEPDDTIARYRCVIQVNRESTVEASPTEFPKSVGVFSVFLLNGDAGQVSREWELQRLDWAGLEIDSEIEKLGRGQWRVSCEIDSDEDTLALGTMYFQHPEHIGLHDRVVVRFNAN